MKKSFAQSSYLAQVRRLRLLAKAALTRYPLRVRKIEFINHGENATFQVFAAGGRKYLLRICRNDYHTRPALLEELQWLSHLGRRGLKVPKPVRSKTGHLVETAEHPDFPEGRNCCLFDWIEGNFVQKSLNPHHMFQVGQILADLQDNIASPPREAPPLLDTRWTCRCRAEVWFHRSFRKRSNELRAAVSSSKLYMQGILNKTKQ